jgi:hypothetical protein
LFALAVRQSAIPLASARMPRSNALAKPLPSPDVREVHALAEVRRFAAPPRPAVLSNDYLNHYSEALMLIELAAAEPELATELRDWRPLGYRAYFEASPLRRAPEALAAYRALTDAQRGAFEALMLAMDALATAAIAGSRSVVLTTTWKRSRPRSRNSGAGPSTSVSGTTTPSATRPAAARAALPSSARQTTRIRSANGG